MNRREAINRKTAFLAILFLSTLTGGIQALAADDSPFALPASTRPDHIDFTSDHFDYDRSSSVVHLAGHVWLRQSTQTVRSNEIWINTEKKRAKAVGYVQMEDGKNLMFGDQGDFNLDNGEGNLTNAAAGFAPWRVNGKYAKRNAKQDISFWHAWFTSCNKDPSPHFYIRSSYMKVRPEKWIISFNDVFFIHQIPVFYTPFFWKSLRKKHILRTRVHFGNDHRNGSEVETFTLFDLSSSVLGKILLDYYSRQGIGYGSEIQFKSATNKFDHGALFAYRIREKNTNQVRWTVQGDDFQTLTKRDAFQMRLQTQSDAAFGNDYVRQSNFAITPQLFNNGALVHNASWGTTRVSYSREDDEDPVLQRYFKTTESSPRLDYSSPALGIWKLPWLNTFSGFEDNTYTRGQSFIQRTMGSTWGMTRSFRIGPGFSFVPNLSLNSTYLKENSLTDAFGNSRTFYDSFTGRYTASGDFRKKTWIGDIDLSHGYTRRMKPNVLVADVLQNDRGVEANATSLSDILMIKRSLWLHVISGYDYRTYRNQTIWYEDRIQPLTSDVNWTPVHNFNLQLRDQYQMHQGGQAAALQADWGERGGKFLGLGFENNLSSASYYVASQEFGWKPSSGTWSAGLTFRTLLHSNGGMRFDLFAPFVKEFWLKKDFHDFHTELLLRSRPGGIKEGMVYIQLRLDTERPVVENKEDAPWRTWKTEP